MQARNKELLLITYFAALAAFAPFSTDIYLASMPTIMQLFGTTVSGIQLSLSLFFVGFALAQLVWGPLSDRVGRKAVIVVGVCIFVGGSVLCAISQSLVQLMVARVIQAIGACSGIVVAIAMVKDLFVEHHKRSKVLSVITSTMMTAPMIAPVIGSYLLSTIGWRANFVFLAVYGALLLAGAWVIKETHPRSSRQFLSVKQLARAYWQQLKHPPFLLAIIATSTNFSITFAFISASPFIYIDIYHVAVRTFGFLFACNALALILGSITLNRMKSKLSDLNITLLGLAFSMSGSLLMILSLSFVSGSLWAVVVTSFITTFGVGVLYPELMSQSLKHVVAHTGLSSSLLGTMRFTLAALTSVIMGMLITTSALPLGAVMLVFSAMTVVSMSGYFYLQRRGSEE